MMDGWLQSMQLPEVHLGVMPATPALPPRYAQTPQTQMLQPGGMTVQPRSGPVAAPEGPSLLGRVSAVLQDKDRLGGLLEGLGAAGAALSRAGAPSLDPANRATAWSQAGQAFTQAQRAHQDRLRELASSKAAAELKRRQVAAQEMTAQAAMAKATKDAELRRQQLEQLGIAPGMGGEAAGAEAQEGVTAGMSPEEIAYISGAENPVQAFNEVIKRRQDQRNKRFDQATTVRKEFEKATAPLNTIIYAGQRAEQLLQLPGDMDAVAQLEALYSFVKAMDPESVVREGEVALAAQAQSLMGAMEGALKKVSEGHVIEPEVAKALAQRVVGLARDAQTAYSNKRDYFSGLATRAGLDPQNVLIPSSVSVSDTDQPAPGTPDNPIPLD